MKNLLVDNRYHHSEYCEWVYNKDKQELLLYFRPYERIKDRPDYFFVSFENVVGYRLYHTDNSYTELFEFQRDLNIERGMLFELEHSSLTQSGNYAGYHHYLTIQPYNGLLEIFAKSYKILN